MAKYKEGDSLYFKGTLPVIVESVIGDHDQSSYWIAEYLSRNNSKFQGMAYDNELHPLNIMERVARIEAELNLD